MYLTGWRITRITFQPRISYSVCPTSFSEHLAQTNIGSLSNFVVATYMPLTCQYQLRSVACCGASDDEGTRLLNIGHHCLRLPGSTDLTRLSCILRKSIESRRQRGRMLLDQSRSTIGRVPAKRRNPMQGLSDASQTGKTAINMAETAPHGLLGMSWNSVCSDILAGES
ncbi:hypothetical protein BU24DRAFT_76859 [Aaosphaeria arxii CBS 175.79]|uniref:Uncharacterized protein n=1 Tax=Aaosphaeria arxii CBS 175.79 TaxID=1450172 RepID=A0A6A5X9C9_9PLEO|nr:uncharacterized protein BU24DRAFT_76859 [Aaosphaeria arxii CBS 175.79]KAF2009520.1 hypothetical protein BU24DRAFT_76859 [Aaosphaeria arxii CBS 175.79]